MRRSFVALTLFAAAISWAPVARAESRECTAAAEAAQTLRNSGKLVQARERLLACMKGCPTVVQNDCGQWLHDVEQRLPSIVVRATDPAGKEITDVRVTVDGTVLATRLDGLAIPVDPGARKLVFEHEGLPAVTEEVTIREGEKARAVMARFKEQPKELLAAPSRTERRIPTSSFILGGVGIVGLGMFTVYHLSAKSDLDGLRDTCAPRCAQDEVDKVDTKIFVSNFALGIGIAAIAGAVLVWLVDGKTTVATKTGSTSLVDPRAPLRFRF